MGLAKEFGEEFRKVASFSGVLPVVPTPFTVDNATDLPSLRRIVDYAVDCGVNAVVYPGVASEDVQLSTDERAECVACVVEAAAGRVEVIAGVNSSEAAEMVSLAKTMSGLGVDGIMAMAVPSMAEQGYAHWYGEIANVTGGLPIILQNLFAPRGADLSAAQILELARDVEAIRYAKEEAIPSGPKVSAMVEGAGDTLDGVIGGGGARYVFEELERGVIATMPAIELLELHVALLRKYFAGDREGALRLYEESVSLLLLQAPYRMRLTKLILKDKGIIEHDGVREGLPELDAVTERLIREFYQRISLDCADNG